MNIVIEFSWNHHQISNFHHLNRWIFEIWWLAMHVYRHNKFTVFIGEIFSKKQQPQMSWKQRRSIILYKKLIILLLLKINDIKKGTSNKVGQLFYFQWAYNSQNNSFYFFMYFWKHTSYSTTILPVNYIATPHRRRIIGKQYSFSE